MQKDAHTIARAAPAGLADAGDIGVYVHIPFCERVCPYCDFAVVAARSLEPEREQRYVDALLAELALRAGPLADRRLATIYLGGGTPALLRPESVARLLAGIRARFNASAGAPGEVTLEANPSTLECARLEAFRGAGVDRLSLGVQSFDDTILHKLGRGHRSQDAHAALAAARSAGFVHVSVDLIFGAPGGSPDQLARDLDQITRYAPEHVSTYELTVEPGTPFALAAARGQLERPGEDAVIGMMEQIEGCLGAAGLVRYEQSSHARPGAEARHNRRYWRREPVLGLGLGAWTNLPRSEAALHGARERNLRVLDAYLESIEAGGSPVCERDVPDPKTARGEAVMLGLRQREGFDAAAFEREFGAPLRSFYGPALERLARAGLLFEADGRWCLSDRGQLLSDEIVLEIL